MKYFDVHAHIFPDKIADKVVDTLEVYYGFKWQGRGTPEDLIAGMDAAGVEKTVVFSCATRIDQVAPANEYLARVKECYSERFYALGTIHPDCPDPGKVIKNIQNYGLHGIKLHPDFQKIYIDEPAMMRIYGILPENFPLMIHMGDPRTDFSSPYRLARVLDEFPHLTVIAAHFGGYAEWDQVWKHLIGRNVFFDTSSSIFRLGAENAAKIVRAHGADKILFASDYPALLPAAAIEDVLAMGLDADENSRIFHLNAQRIFEKW